MKVLLKYLYSKALCSNIYIYALAIAGQTAKPNWLKLYFSRWKLNFFLFYGQRRALQLVFWILNSVVQEDGLEEENCFQPLEGEMNKLRIYGSQPYSPQHLDIEIKLPQPLVCSRYTKWIDLMQIFEILRFLSKELRLCHKLKIANPYIHET